MTTEPAESAQLDTGLRCPKCRYNLTAVTSSTCPECGEPFVVTNAQGYLAKFPPSQLRRALVAVWVIGSVLIVMSWVNAVPALVGWLGFGLAGVAWLTGLAVRR